MPDSAALSVLLLAWDEAAPTVRTVVEAAPTLGSLLVLLPPLAAGAAPNPPAPVAEVPAPATPSEPTAADTAMPAAAPQLPAASLLATPLVATTILAGAPTVAAPAAATPLAPPATQAPAAASPAVRLVHLPASLPATTRYASTYQTPAAPYLGATPTADLPAAPASLPAAPASALPAATPASDFSSAPAASLPAVPGAAVVPPLADVAFQSVDLLDASPEDELPPQLAEFRPAATPADTPALSDLPPLPASAEPLGVNLPASLPPTPATTPPAAEPSAEAPPELPEALLPPESATRPPQYTAPDLNSQVIRYARLAVPTALADGLPDVVYAPAWPTWLAALELRQRTGQPLVLHLLALAAGRQPADTAAGWAAELQRQVLRQADLVLVETYALARRLRRELGLSTSTVRVVPARDVGALARALHRARRA